MEQLRATGTEGKVLLDLPVGDRALGARDDGGVDLSRSSDYDELLALVDEAFVPPLELGEEGGGARETWKRVEALCRSILTRSKDLWVAVWAVSAATYLDRVGGLERGLSGVARMLGQWEQLYPRAGDDEPFASQRINAINELSTPRALKLLREVELFAPSDQKPVRVRDVLVAGGAWSAAEGEAPIGPDDLRELFRQSQEADGEAAEVLLAQCGAAREHLDSIAEQVRRVNGQAAALLHLEEPRKYLSTVLRMLGNGPDAMGTTTMTTTTAPPAAAGAEGNGTAGGVAGAGAAPGASTAGARIDGEITTREQAAAVIDKVIRYIERTEPSSPAPLLLERGKRLIGRKFLDCLEDLNSTGLLNGLKDNGS